MLANEARKNASEVIWNSLPSIIRHNIEDAVNEGKLNCEIIFPKDNVDKFNECTEYFQNLKDLGYDVAMHKPYSDCVMYYVITIIW
jgi:hypothetical protein